MNEKQSNKMILFTQPNCGLCVDAKIQLDLIKEELKSQSLEIEEINIQTNEDLLQQYMLRVPVLIYRDHIIQEGNIDFVTVLDKLKSLT
ncbi:glutaredoxin family protein [Macrococcus sp. DPC7161]|uniref:glutaredoxin family protein n=1 Tax=Macrococcus sp. DPC7161 TaxID=2507060 RepID=UPI001F0B7BDC|nr:glutaredoxin family protein [Macrococcus sp. DPC7161]